MGMQGYIVAAFNNQADLEEFVQFLAEETGGEPAEVNGLEIEFNFFSHGDRMVFRDFLREKGARIISDVVTDDSDVTNDDE